MQINRPQRQNRLDRYFAFIERRRLSDRLLFQLTSIAVLVSLVWFIASINNHFATTVPTSGGTLVEGIIGTPRFVNPVLAITRADQDMVSLVYSGLMKLDSEGELIPDIAKTIDISEDGRTYNIKIREDVTFHDGSPLTVKDVAYTIALIQNPELKSPLQGNWEGVLVEELGDYEMNIVLDEAYTPFMENLRVGIVPRVLWDELPTEQLPFSQHNTEPIGSGPYKITDALRNKSGLIKGYRLDAFSDYGQEPNISTLVFNFYQNEEDLIEALNDEEIAGTASLTSIDEALINTDKYGMVEKSLPRTFAVYFNQNKSAILRDRAVREALNVMIDREELIADILDGYGVPTDGPVPTGFVSFPESTTTNESSTSENFDRVTKARSILTDGGWTQNEEGKWVKNIDEDNEITLSFTIATANTPLFEATANYVAETWRLLGAEVAVNQFAQADLVQAVIRPRNFEALLFGAEIGRSVDLYPFWHSSQKDDPGLNIAEYTNIDADSLLEDIRVATTSEERVSKTARVVDLITEEHPAIFLFSPTFRYLLDPAVAMTPLSRMSSPSDRFANISTWHIKANKVWPIFQRQEQVGF